MGLLFPVRRRQRRRGRPWAADAEAWPVPRRARSWRVPVALLLLAGLGLAAWNGWSLRRVHHAIDRGWRQAITHLEVHNISEQVRLHHLAEGRYPVDFKSFMGTIRRPRSDRRPWQDAWGGEFLLDAGSGTFEVRSPGPDRRPYTRDDLVVKAHVLPARMH